MPYAEHVRVVASGLLGTDDPAPEEWSCSLNLQFATQADIDQAFCDGLFDNWSAFIQDADAKFSTAVRLTTVKCGLVDTTGHIPGTNFRTDDEANGAQETILHPFQCTLAVSLRTGLRGPAKRGRFYLPPQGVAIREQDGLIADSDRTDIEGAVGTFLGNVNTAAGGDGPDDVKIVVASSNGNNYEVTAFQVGRVFDTQRRRRRSLDENYGTLQPIP